MLTCTDPPCLCMPIYHGLTFLSDTSSLWSYSLIHMRTSLMHTLASPQLHTPPHVLTSHSNNHTWLLAHVNLSQDSHQFISQLIIRIATHNTLSLNLWLNAELFIHSYVYSSLPDLAVHDPRLMLTHLKIHSHLSFVSYRFIPQLIKIHIYF